MKAAVYSGSFNPLHIGHLAIIRYLVTEGGYDCVYLIVSPQNPFKSEDNLLSAKARLEAAREAAARYPELSIKVDDIEFGMEPPHYTFRTLNALSLREPDNQFTLVIGADNLCAFKRWRNYGEILLKYGVEVYPRTGYDLQGAMAELLKENSAYRINILNAPVVDISSTQIREMLSQGEDPADLLM